MDENRNSKVHTIIDSGAIVSIVGRDVLNKRYKILKDKKNKWSTMVGTFNTTFVAEMILQLLELKHSAKVYAIYHLTDKDLITI